MSTRDILKDKIGALSSFMSRYWEQEEGHSLKEIFQKHGDPARKMWRSSLICFANASVQDGHEEAGAVLHRMARHYLPKEP